jgi:Ran GTPase-activating protein (RanGAP) involved in mRNA processing and transport
MLKTRISLVELDLSNNGIGTEGANYISDALIVNTNMTKLCLARNAIGKEGMPRMMTEALEVNHALVSLDLSNNSLGVGSMRHVGRIISSNSCLTALDLTRNGFESHGAKFISDALKSNSTLQKIRLDCNNLGDIGMFWIAQALKVNSSLKDIQLSSTGIGCNAMIFFAEALEQGNNSSLESSCATHNSIGDQGAYWIGEALKVNSSLRYLSLFQNGFATKGVESIIEALDENISMCNIDCSCYLVLSLKANEALTKCIHRRRTTFRMLLCSLVSRRNEILNQIFDTQILTLYLFPFLGIQ